jgi:Polyferredoxin
MKYSNIRKPIVITTAVLFHLLLIFHLLFSPVIIILAANQGLMNASFISFGVMFLLSLFAGRAYCAWFCPGCGIQEVLSLWVRKKSPNDKAVYIKYFIFAVWAGIITIFYILKGIHKIDLSFGMTNITVARKLMLTAGAIVIIAPLTIIFGRFASCKYICWQAPLLIFGSKLRDLLGLPGLRLQIEALKCKACNACTFKCPMNIDLMASIKGIYIQATECILCGNCIDTCEQQALSYRFTIPGREKVAQNIPDREV